MGAYGRFELRYVRTDRNGTKYFLDDNCPRCSGYGELDKWIETGRVCFACGGTGRRPQPKTVKVYTPEHEAKLEARRAARAPKKDAEALEKARRLVEETRINTWVYEGFGRDGVGYLHTGNTYKNREDMKQSHPLLNAVDTVNATGLMKFLLNTDTGDNAAWGALESAITKEVASGFAEIDMGQFKLSAWMPISVDMLELGPNWLDSYIRTCLSEALAIGFENAVVTGTGKDMPIGMDRSVADDVVVTGGVYPKKDAVTVTDFGRASYGNLVSQLAQTQKGKPRAVRGLILVVNPFDYYKTVMPATTLMTPEGRFVNDVLPVPTEIIQSVAVARNEAILGMGKRYFLGVGGRRGIQFSDDYKFLEDQRYYKIVAYANGRPKDDHAFLRLNIANLEPTYLEVKNVTEG